MKYIFKKIQTPIGQLVIVARGDLLHAILFECTWSKFREHLFDLTQGDASIISATQKQLTEYFSGKRKQFDLPFELTGTEFQNRTWQALLKIPFGRTATYKEQASTIASPNASRAVGRANGLNKLCILLPCHRVIGSDGSLTGYAGGMEAKRFLLGLEGGVKVTGIFGQPSPRNDEVAGRFD